MQTVKGHKKELKMLLVAVGAYILILLLFNLWKYFANEYNVLDLAIYNQVFWNLTHGNGLYSSIQQGHYFGDHAEFLILLAAPIYALLPHPLTLLALQTIGLASSIFPIYFLAKLLLRERARSIALIVAFLWLINPIVWNINFFEFHILPFTVPLVLWTIYFLLTNRWRLYWLFLFLSLLVREDVALITLMLGFIGLVRPASSIKQTRFAGFITILISTTWFFGATKFIQYFSTDASYKYLSYYSWLGNSLVEIVKNAFLHPLIMVKHIMTLPNFEMILGFLLVFLFLPLLRPRFLLLAFIPLLQFILHGSGGSALVLEIHYAALFLPALAVSFIFGLRFLLDNLPKYHFVILSIVIITAVYNFLILGPLPAAAKAIARDLRNPVWQEENKLLSTIPKNTSVAATYMPLAKLSSRKNLYALHYIYVGKKQFSQEDYKIPELPDYLVIDEQELGTFKVQYESLAWSAATAQDGFKRLEDLIAAGDYGVLKRARNLVLLQKNLSKSSGLYHLPAISPNLRGYIILNNIRSGETVFSK